MREAAKQIIAVAMLVVSAFVFFAVFGSPEAGGRPFIPALVPFFGIEFGIAFAVFQFAYCLLFNAKKGFLWILAVWIAVAAVIPMVYMGLAFAHPNAIPPHIRIITGAPLASAVALGIGALKGKV